MQANKFSWMDPRLEIRDTDAYGRGIYAKEPIRKDQTLIVMGGYILNTSEENALGEFATNYNMDLSEEYSFCPRQESDIDLMPQHLVNHSCEPNSGFRDTYSLVAVRDIQAGEQITYDYAFVMWSSDESQHHYTLNCLCGSPSCRKIITENDWKIPELQQEYGEYFQPFLRRKFQ